jgi:SAM-dependent methyltransferase
VTFREPAGSGSDVRGYGRVFNEIAEEYDRHRPAYPDALIDRACGLARLTRGDRVLEVGCGTGQLTRSLLARGLLVTAVEPGEQLIARARTQLTGAGEVRYINARLEGATLPRERYSAAFSASAIHWVDPDVSWRKLAGALVDGGTLALVSYFGLEDSRSVGDQRALRDALAGIAPDLAAEWPSYRGHEQLVAGVAQRRANVSEAWAWLGSYDLARAYAADLFEDTRLETIVLEVEHTADELNALTATMSFWSRMSAWQRDAVAAANHALYRRLGRPIRSTTVACLLTARKSDGSTATNRHDGP